jgi:hypothetical protein
VCECVSVCVGGGGVTVELTCSLAHSLAHSLDQSTILVH